MAKEPLMHTYSLIAYDPESASWGVGVASKFLAIGAYVPYAQAGVGAIATQADGNPSFGPRGLELLAKGKTVQETLDELLQSDTNPEARQVGIVDAAGRSVTYTGKKCFAWAGGIAKNNFAIQGNTLVGEDTLLAIEKAFIDTKGELAHRLYAAILAGEAAGGDSRGKQAASLLVVKEKAGYGGHNDRFLDLRVDDHPTPLIELGRLLKLHDLYLGSTPQDKKVKIDAVLTEQLQQTLQRLGYYTGEVTGLWDDKTQDAFYRFAGVENLEERIDAPKGLIDPPALAFIKEKFFQ